MNVEKQVAYWLDSAQEDCEVAEQLMESGRYRHGLFLAHLTLEKALKAVYTKRLIQVPPKTHHLARLAELCKLEVTKEQAMALDEINSYNMEGRYPEMYPPHLNKTQALMLMKNAEGLYQWLKNQL